MLITNEHSHDKCCRPQVFQTLIKRDKRYKDLVYWTNSMGPPPATHLGMWSYNKQKGEPGALFPFWLIQHREYFVSFNFISENWIY